MTHSPEEAENLRIAREMYETVLIPLDPTHCDRYFSQAYRQHSALAADGLQALKDFLVWARADAPEAHTEIKRVFVDGDHVIFHVHVVRFPGTQGYSVVDIFRMADGKIAEHWDVVQEIPETLLHGNGML